MKKKYKCLNLDDYIFPGCREITGDELYRINGGGRIQPEQNENPPEGDSSNNSDSYTVQSGDTLSQIVYDYNQANGTHLTVDEVAALSGIENPDVIFPGQDIIFGTSDTSGQTTDPTNPAESTSTSSNPSSTSSENSSANSGTTVPDFADPFAPVSNGNFGVDNVNQIISADINNPQSVIDAYNSYYIQADRGYKFQIKDGDEVVHTFSDAKYARNYVKTLDPSDSKVKKIFSKIFVNDGSDKIYTTGVSASTTYPLGSEAIGIGFYINPKNDFLYSISSQMIESNNPVKKIIGTIIGSCNVEDCGFYYEGSAGVGGGLAASIGMNYGEYKDLESAQGKYYESGLSAGPNGISLGVDFVCDSEYQYIGNTTSLSFGVGTPEGHTRLGGTRLYSVMRKEND